MLLLWQHDLIADLPFKVICSVIRFFSLFYQRLWLIVGRIRLRAASAWRLFRSGTREHPIAVGMLVAMTLLAGFLLFTRAGRSLRADCRYYWAVHWGHPSLEVQSQRLVYALDLVPDHAAARVDLGNVAVQSKDWEAAMSQYGMVAGTDGAGANNLGVLLLRKGDLSAALEALTWSVRLEPDVAISHQNLGIAYLRLGQQREAARAFKEALRIESTLTIARYHLGMYHLSQGALLEAAASFERVLEQDVTCAPAHVGIGLIHAQIGDWEGAARAFQQAVALDPGSAIAHYHLGWALARAGREVEAQAALARVLQLASSQELSERVSAMMSEGANNVSQEGTMDSGP